MKGNFDLFIYVQQYYSNSLTGEEFLYNLPDWEESPAPIVYRYPDEFPDDLTLTISFIKSMIASVPD